MSSTYLSLHYHLVFGTQNRIPSIDMLKSFREEFVELLEKAGVEYDPRYLD